MMCSPARLAANRRNAARSTGPKTEAGKARSRTNALKHGLAAQTLVAPDEAAAVATVPDDRWIEREAGVLAVRLDLAHRVEDHERDHAALRAETCWDVDRQQEVARIAAGLGRRPERVAARLRGSVHGCDWLIQRWEWLARAAGRPGGWDEDQTRLALDLRGVPAALRSAAPDEDPAALAATEIAALRALRVRLEPSDRLQRQAARQGLDDDATPALRRAIRYAADLFRRLRWCLEAAPVEDEAADEPEPTPKPIPAPSRVVPEVPRPAVVGVRTKSTHPSDWSQSQFPPAGFDLPTSCVPLAMVPTPPLRR